MNNLIYLMGAGRSGTTALAIFLGNSIDILTLGEMHQFFEHIGADKQCSCGNRLSQCDFWGKIIKDLPMDFLTDPEKYLDFCKNFEYHNAIVNYAFNLFNNNDIQKYLRINETILDSISKENEEIYFLDSAKYIGRVLGLRKSKKINLKIIYVVRDIRGVINSFSKKVQSQKKPLNTIIYWLIINSIAEFIYKTSPKGTVLKIRYETLIDNPEKEFGRIENFLNLDLTSIKDKIRENNSFEMPHLIGGNRLKKHNKLYFSRDLEWRERFSTLKKIFYYLMALPLMLINRFKI